MLISELSKSLKRFSDSIQITLQNPSVSINGLLYLTDQKELNSYTLYVLFDSQLPETLLKPDHTYTFLILSPDAQIPESHRASLNIFWEIRSSRFSSMIDKISDILARNYHLAETMMHTSEKFFQKEGLSAILESAYEFFQSPLLLVDCNYKLIAHAPADEPYINMLTSVENSPKSSFDSTLKNIQMQIAQYTKPSYLKHPFNNYNILIQNIYINNFLIGSLFLVEDNPFTQTDFDGFASLVQTVTCELSNNLLYSQTNGHIFSTSLYDILADVSRPAYMISQQLHSLGLFELKDMRFITFQFHHAPMYQIFSNLLKDIDRLFSPDIYTLSDNRIILFLTGKTRTSDHFYLQYLKELQKKYQLYIGISNLFHDISGIHSCYQQSLSALEHHRTGTDYQQQDYVFFEDIAFAELFQKLNDSICLSDYCSTAIKDLIQYDAENNTQLAETLYIYFLCYGDSVLAAQRLSIHKNTFYYRLRMIREILDNDLTDGRTNEYYFFSLQALHFTNHFTPPDC